MVTRLCKDYNDANPNWQAAGGNIRSGRFDYLPAKVAPCGQAARRHHGTKTGPPNGCMIGRVGGVEESCRGMFMTVAGNVHHSAFWQAHEQFPQRPEFFDFKESTGANSAPAPCTVAELQDLEAADVCAGFNLPSDRTFRHIALVMGDHFRTFCRTSRLFKPPLKCMAELDAVNPQLALVRLHAAASSPASRQPLAGEPAAASRRTSGGLQQANPHSACLKITVHNAHEHSAFRRERKNDGGGRLVG